MDTPKTPENAPRIPKDDSFKTCKASPAVRRQLRATPARLSILSGGKPFKEVSSSHKKFNSRRKAGHHNDTAGSNETFIRHEQELLYDRDSLDPSRDTPLHFLDNVIERGAAPRTSSPKFRSITEADQEDATALLSMNEQVTPKRSTVARKSSPRKVSPKKVSPSKKASPRKSKSPNKVQTTRVFAKPLPKPRPIANAKPKATPAVQWNRYMSSTAKKPYGQQAPQFRIPQAPVMNSSVASSRRCLGQWNTPRITRTQSFKSTAELERDYFTSLRSSRS